MRTWRDISYLKRGDPMQMEVYELMCEINVLGKLKAFDPILTGTYPIGIYLPGSDLDIACVYQDKHEFLDALKDAFKNHNYFMLKEKEIRGIESVICRFEYNDYLIEIFGQPIPVEEQYSYRHMLMEHQLLKENDETFREDIIALKKKGFSTEEAFAELLGIEGDPYEELLNVFESL
jgi:hypothetical protein